MSSQGVTQIRITCAGVRMGIGRSGKRGATYVSITGSPDVLVAPAEGWLGPPLRFGLIFLHRTRDIPIVGCGVNIPSRHTLHTVWHTWTAVFLLPDIE